MMFKVGDLVEDNEYEGSYGYIVGSVKLRGSVNKRFVTNYHVKLIGDTDDEIIIFEEDRLTKVS